MVLNYQDKNYSDSDRNVSIDSEETQETESLIMNNPDTHSSQNYLYNQCQGNQERMMRKKLKFFFMNPVEKWHTKRRFPYKFLVQVFKIILVSIQLCLFAHNRYKHVTYSWDSAITFSHLFLKGWDSTREVNSYPPSLGTFAIYNKVDFYRTIDFGVVGYSNLSNAIGPYSYTREDNRIEPPQLCISHYKEGTIFAFNSSFIFNSDVITSCIEIDVQKNAINFSSLEYFHKNDFHIDFTSLKTAILKFSLKTINLKAAGPITPPDCFQFNIEILFDNDNMDGQMKLSLESTPVRLECNGELKYVDDGRLDYILRTILNLLVIIVCGISFILCTRAIIKAQHLKLETIRFFKEHLHRDLSVEGRFEFWNLWYIMIIINDLLIICGSAMKEQIERQQYVGDQWNTCSVFLGCGNLLVWFGVLRYLGFFKTYNVVILTLKKACPQVARFLLCALLIYAGFTFCGWLVLGPYHPKFRSLAGTSECLFALINGDDMYATFSMMTFKSTLLWWFSRLYLYSFISLYIYVVLSLFISVIMDAYETIKLYYKEGFPKNDVQAFISIPDNDPMGNDYQFQSSCQAPKISYKETFLNLFCCRPPMKPMLKPKSRKLLIPIEYSSFF